MCLERHGPILRGDCGRQRALGESHQPVLGAGRRQQRLFERRGVEDVVLRVGLRQPFALGGGESVQLVEDGQRLVQSAQTECHQPEGVQSAALQPVRSVRKDLVLGLLQQAVRQAQVAAAVLDLRRLERPGAGFQQRVTRRAAKLGDPGGFAGRILDPAFRKEEVAQVTSRQDLAFNVTPALKPVGRLSVQRLSALRVTAAIDVSVGKRQPQVLWGLCDQAIEEPSPFVPQALLERHLVETVGRLVVVRLLRKLLCALRERILGGRGDGGQQVCCHRRRAEEPNERTQCDCQVQLRC